MRNSLLYLLIIALPCCKVETDLPTGGAASNPRSILHDAPDPSGLAWGKYALASCVPVPIPDGPNNVAINEYYITSLDGEELPYRYHTTLTFFCNYELSSRLEVDVSGYFMDVSRSTPWSSFPDDCPEANYLARRGPGEFFRVERVFVVTGIRQPISEHNRYMKFLEDIATIESASDLEFVQSIDFEKAYR